MPATPRIRSLITQELPLLREHLLRLDPESRHHRFNGCASDTFIETYAARCAADGTIILACVEDGAVRAAAELHQPDLTPGSLPEVAFSVEKCLRRQGIGSTLFRRLIAVADSLGYESLRITTGSQNHPMRALASKFGAHLAFRQGESTGIIAVGQPAARQVGDPAADPGPAYWRMLASLTGSGPTA